MSLFKLLAFAAMMSSLEEELSSISKRKRDTTPKVVGDKLQLIDPFSINYFIDVETDSQLSTDFNTISRPILDIFRASEIIVAEIDIEKKYNCGHCENEHIHDMIVYIPSMKKRFYASSDYFKVIK